MARGETRSAARLAIVQALYQLEIAGKGVNEAIGEFEAHWLGREIDDIPGRKADEGFFRDVVSGVVREQRLIDPLIDEALDRGWPLKRVESVLRAILRAGAYELRFRSDVPPRVAIAEYVALADAFDGAGEAALINGVLDHIARNHRADELARRAE
jgi:N utilization substance protein B